MVPDSSAQNIFIPELESSDVAMMRYLPSHPEIANFVEPFAPRSSVVKFSQP